VDVPSLGQRKPGENTPTLEDSTVGEQYFGYNTSVASKVASRILYEASIDKTKAMCYNILKPFHMEEKDHKTLANEGGDMLSTLLTQFISVPSDIVSFTN
jgi:hypothetical protein